MLSVRLSVLDEFSTCAWQRVCACACSSGSRRRAREASPRQSTEHGTPTRILEAKDNRCWDPCHGERYNAVETRLPSLAYSVCVVGWVLRCWCNNVCQSLHCATALCNSSAHRQFGQGNFIWSVALSGAKTINVFRACLGAQLTICAQKWRNFVLFSTVSFRFVLSRVCVFLYSLGPWCGNIWCTFMWSLHHHHFKFYKFIGRNYITKISLFYR